MSILHSHPYEEKRTPWEQVFNEFEQQAHMLYEFRESVPEDAAITFFQGINQYNILPHAIGKFPLRHIEFMIDSLNVPINFGENNKQNPVLLSIQNAAKPQELKYWTQYWMPLIAMLSSRGFQNYRNDESSSNNSQEEEITPMSRIFNYVGRYLVVHIAPEQGLPWCCIKDLLEDDTDMLQEHDANGTGLYPFMLAASASVKTDTSSLSSREVQSNLSTCFEMLVECPVVLFLSVTTLKKGDEKCWMNILRKEEKMSLSSET